MPFVTPALHHTSRGLRAALVVCAVATLVPLIHGELLPFTNAALFTDAQPFFTDYSLRDAEGKPLDPHDFGLGPV